MSAASVMPPFGQLALVARVHAFEEGVHGHLLAAQRPAAAFEPRELEQVADDPLEPMRLVVDDVQVALARRLVERQLLHRQRFEVAAHRGQRRHQLVRDVGEQLAPRLVGRVERRARAAPARRPSG